MTPSMRELACAVTALLVASFGAQAQPPSGTPAAPPGMTTPPPAVDPQRKAGPDPHPQAPQTAAGAVPGDAKATADATYGAAQKACGAKTAADKDACLAEARAAYDRALGRKEATPPPATPAPAGAPADTKRK